MTETFTREELIERAEKAESRIQELEQACRHSSDWATCAIEDMKKAEAEVATLLARLKSTESALDRAMARSNSWREEAAKLQAQMLADRGQRDAEAKRLRGALSDLDRMIFNDPQVIERAGQFREYIRGALALGDQSPAETPRTCETCANEEVRSFVRLPCWTCQRSDGYPNWTPKPIPSTTDKGEKP